MASSSLGTVVAIAYCGPAVRGPTVSTVVIVTLLVLIFGEILPKSMAKEHAECNRPSRVAGIHGRAAQRYVSSCS